MSVFTAVLTHTSLAFEVHDMIHTGRDAVWLLMSCLHHRSSIKRAIYSACVNTAAFQLAPSHTWLAYRYVL